MEGCNEERERILRERSNLRAEVSARAREADKIQPRSAKSSAIGYTSPLDSLDARAEDALEADLAGISFNRSVDESGRRALDVVCSFCIGESLVRGSLLEAVGVCDVPLPLGSSCVAEEAKDRVCDVVRVVEE